MWPILLLLHASLKIAIQLNQCEIHYLKRFLKGILMCKFCCGLKYKTHISPWCCFPTRCSSKAGGLCENQINPESCSPSSIRPRQGRITHVLLVRCWFLGLTPGFGKQSCLSGCLRTLNSFSPILQAGKTQRLREKQNNTHTNKQKLKKKYKINLKTTHTHNRMH